MFIAKPNVAIRLSSGAFLTQGAISKEGLIGPRNSRTILQLLS